MNDYFDGAISQLIERGKHLIAMIPTGLPPELTPLERKCRDELSGRLDELRELVTAETWLAPENQPKRLRQFRRLIRGLDIIETVCIPALERAKLESDLHLNRLVERIRQEIHYPLPPPVVAPFSQAYFRTWPGFHLMLVPLSEGDFLLHLPDLYHELGHPLFYERYDPKIKPLWDARLEAIDEVTIYIEDELEKEKRRNGDWLSSCLESWLVCWLKGWADEFFCDLFAVCTLGPAFVWSHFHLSATRGEDPYEIPFGARLMSHPADAARMAAMLEELTLIGFAKEAAKIEDRWNLFLSTTQAKMEPEYLRCFPRHILRMLSRRAFEGVERMGCRIAKPDTNDFVHKVFNDAWSEFWCDPAQYVSWEKRTVEALKKHCKGAA